MGRFLYLLGCETVLSAGRYIDGSEGESVYDVFDCKFSRNMVFSGSGGVIWINVAGMSLNLGSCLFYECKCSGSGGSVFFNSQNANVRMACAYKNGADYSHFARFISSNATKAEYISISSSSQTTTGHDSICLQNGIQTFLSSNSSMNKNQWYSGMLTYIPASFLGAYCNFANNIVSDYTCVYFCFNNGQMSWSNIVNNNSPKEYSVVLSKGLYTMSYCIFARNSNVLLSSIQDNLKVLHSYIAHSGTKVSGLVTTVSNCSMITMNTHKIGFFGTIYCNADFSIRIEKPTTLSTRRQYGFFMLVFLINNYV